MEQEPIYVGIDVAKAQVDVAVRPTDDRWEVSHDETGVRHLVSQLKALEPVMVLLEASGGLEVPLVAALAAHSVPVVVVNPRQVRDFARATGKLAKTDALDAAVLAHFAEAVRPPVRPLRDTETQALNSLAARRHQVMTMLVSEKNRLSSATIAVRPRIEAHIAWLEQELDDLDEGLRQTLRQSPVWREKDDLLRTVPGVGEQLSPSLSWPICRSWARWTAGRSPPWWVWLPSTGTAAPCGANAPSGVDAPASAPPCTWERWLPVASTLLSGTSTNGCWPLVSPRSWPSQPACASCWLSSTPCSSIAHPGAT